jgi:hypothetical protein
MQNVLGIWIVHGVWNLLTHRIFLNRINQHYTISLMGHYRCLDYQASKKYLITGSENQNLILSNNLEHSQM